MLQIKQEKEPHQEEFVTHSQRSNKKMFVHLGHDNYFAHIPENISKFLAIMKFISLTSSFFPSDQQFLLPHSRQKLKDFHPVHSFIHSLIEQIFITQLLCLNHQCHLLVHRVGVKCSRFSFQPGLCAEARCKGDRAPGLKKLPQTGLAFRLSTLWP